MRLSRSGESGRSGGSGRFLHAGLAAIGSLTLALACGLALEAASPRAEAAFAKFWAAGNVTEAETAAADIAKSGVSFDEALALFKQGRTYSASVPKGIVRDAHRIDDVEFAYTLEIPQTYDPANRYQVRMQLHGGVGRPDAAPRGNGIGALAGAEQIYILPTAWNAAEWWTNRQVENLRRILDRVKRTYNVDENRVVLSGVSDGGTGAYYVGMRDTTPFAAFLPLNGALPVLKSTNVRVDGELYPNNFLNKPFFIVNGGRDPLYPTTLVDPYINQMTRTGVTVTYLPQPNAVHNTAWWPEVKDAYETFVKEHPRQPLPDKLTWETDPTGTKRAHWLVIDVLAPPALETARLSDVNDFVAAASPSFGIRANGTRVTAVSAGSNAASLGLRPGDVIDRIGPRQIPGGVDVIELLGINDPGTPLELVVLRDGAPLSLKGTYNPTSAPRITPMFPHASPSGRVDLVKEGNLVTATTRGVKTFTLLISPDAFDFAKPVKVVANGKTVFEKRVSKSLPTLTKWAARDNDRTMLFGAEVTVTLPQ